MSYIGRGIDQIDNISTLDNLTFNGSDATFNLTQNSVAFVPVSSDALQIQIDGIIQSGNYTCSGSQITFDFVPSSSSVCNGIRHFGVGLLTTVSDGAVTTAKLGADSVNGTKIADDSISDEHLDITAITGQTEKTSLADADKFLISDSADSGALKYVQNSNLGGGGRATLIDTITLSSSSTAVFDSSDITSTYDNYLITLENVHCGSGNVEVLMKISNNNGSSYEGDSSNDYRFISFNGIENESNNSFTSRYSTASNKIGITGNYSNNGNDAALKIDSTIECFSLNSSSYKKFLIRTSFGNTDDPPKLVYEHNLAMADSTQAVINNIKIYPSNGNFASGKIKLFGLA